VIVKVLGSGCTNCQNLEKATREALSELGLEASVEHVTDPGDIASYGVMRTPALVVDERVLVSGRVPSTAQVRALLSAAAAG
jgi:small redox-active disulfide protein 2